MIPHFPKLVLRRVIALAVLIILALIVGLTLSARNQNNPNLHMTPIFAATATR